ASQDSGQTFAARPLKNRFPFTGAAVAPDGSLVIVGARGLQRLPAASLAAGVPNTRAARP
ncbi:MAG TPA: photosystem II stability/assembly factor-like protein, partial [Pseudoduganella sp.]